MADSTKAYLCRDGHLRTGEAGSCPEHGTSLQEATHRCPSCGHAALSGGNCPMCGTGMQAI